MLSASHTSIETWNNVGNWINLHAHSEQLSHKVRSECTHLTLTGDYIQEFIPKLEGFTKLTSLKLMNEGINLFPNSIVDLRIFPVLEEFHLQLGIGIENFNEESVLFD